MRANELLIYLSHQEKGDFSSMLQIIKEKRKVLPKDVESFYQNFTQKAVTIVDLGYPACFHECPMPPFCLYYQGNWDLIADKGNCCTIVGSRNPTDYARKKVAEIAGELAKRGVVIVSGLAKGIDAAALQAAAPYGKAVAVLGNGLDQFYPSENRALQEEIAKTGLVLTEYPNGVKPNAENFPCRNRILAALGCAIFVGEAHSRSGTCITANRALEMNREIGALPFRADEASMCNRWIKEGAAMVEDVDDVLDLMGIQRRKELEEKAEE